MGRGQYTPRTLLMTLLLIGVFQLSGCCGNEGDVVVPVDPAHGIRVVNLVVVGWNAESGDANPDVIAARIEELDGVDIWGLCEVQNSSWALSFEFAAEADEAADFQHILGTTGGADRMTIIYDADRLILHDWREIHSINPGGRVRSPLVAHFEIRSNGVEFLFMVNHLYRSKDEERQQQAADLNSWASTQTLPLIAVGDYNFDWNVIGGDSEHCPGFDRMVAGDVFTWIFPEQLMKTQCNPRYNSVLDFVFLHDGSGSWSGSSTILPRDTNDGILDSFPDDDQTTDHRPVRGTFEIRVD